MVTEIYGFTDNKCKEATYSKGYLDSRFADLTNSIRANANNINGLGQRVSQSEVDIINNMAACTNRMNDLETRIEVLERAIREL